jgi:hypothetical protein
MGWEHSTPDERRFLMGVFYDQRTVPGDAGLGTVRLPNPDWNKVLGALAIALVFFGLALWFEHRGINPEARNVLFNLSQVTFTATLALLGIETVKA